MISDKEKFCLDSYIVNGDVDTAYTLSRERKPKATDNLHRMALRWLRNDEIQAYIEERRAIIYQRSDKVTDMQTEDVADLVEAYKNKDFIIAELVKAQMGLTGKEKSDILTRIADLQRMKQDENKVDEKRVHFYMPLPVCDDCQFQENLVKKRRFSTQSEEKLTDTPK